MKSLLLVIVLVGVLMSGCSTAKNLKNNALVGGIVTDIETLAKGVKKGDWHEVHESALRLQDVYVAMQGAKTVRQVYGQHCVGRLEEFFSDTSAGDVRIVQKSHLVKLVEKFGTLSSVNAVTIGDRVIHVGRGKTLNLPHEMEHIQQWRNAKETFLVQYLSTVFLAGYELSIFEQNAQKQAKLFDEMFPGVCEA